MATRLSLNSVSLLSSPICFYSRFSVPTQNCAKSTTTSRCYRRASPNLNFHRFQCSSVKTNDELIKGLKHFKNVKSSEYKISYAFTIRREIAAKIANKVMTSVLSKSKKPVVNEVNPGPGLISQELFRNKLDKLIVYDHVKCPYFMKWYGDNAEKITLINTATKKNIDKLILYTVVKKGVHNVIIISLPNRIFFKRLCYHTIIFKWNSLTNAEFYVTVSETIFKSSLSDGISSSPTGKLCHVLFDFEILDEFKCSDFLPVGRRRGKLYFVRFMRKPVPLLKHKDAETYFLFLKHITPAKSALLIKALESWFPHIGPALIARGVRVTSLVRDFDGEEFLKLFLMIKGLGYDLEVLRKIQYL